MTSLPMSTVTNDIGEYSKVRRVGNYTNEKRKYPKSSFSFTSLQTQLKEANCKMKEQETLQAEREEEALQIAVEHLMIVKKYLSATDPNILAFLESQSIDPATADVQT
ncbi:unnamed protein product [Arabidopsis thaliana]|uniref:(thale cress) hypothetical protein n=1 Tax=Arabidopsis thaliana TaxID=3702 RepID=A0A7G2EPT4_ARATH|nr:unnamed protein product [Arabidopsis thaliana]